MRRYCHGSYRHALLPASRELIADSVETVAEAHRLDGLVCIPNCDKITPGMMMAALRINIPVIFVSGGPMKAGHTPSGKTVDLISVFEAVGQFSAGKISDKELETIEESACPGCGSCSGMFTANSMNCLSEALGFALPGNGTILAIDPRRNELVKQSFETNIEVTGLPVFLDIEFDSPMWQKWGDKCLSCRVSVFAEAIE